MVARTPPKQRKVMVAPLNPALLRETVKKVDKCMARLQELQYTVAGGNKVISGVSLSPRSTRGYLRASLRCKQESLRMKIATPKKSPVGKMPQIAGGEWRRMSLPAMLVGETIGEILQASQFAKEIVAAVSTNKTKKKITPLEDPKTPITQKKTTQNTKNLENTDLKTRRKKEKHNKLQSLRSESDRPSLQRARSRINFKVSSPPKVQELVDKENSRYLANRVSPRNRPWAKKTVLFPNPLFLSATPTSHQQTFGKTRSPIITRKSNNVVNHTKQTPHKFLIKSPVKIRSPQKVVASISPTKLGNLSKKSSSSPLKVSTASKLRRSFSPLRLASPKVVASISPTKLGNLSKKSSSSPLKVSTASKLRRSFSPSRLASRLVSPLKSRKNVQRCDGLMSGLKQRPPSSLVPMQFSTGRI